MGTFDYNKVKNPEYFKENRVEAHSDHKYYGSIIFSGCQKISTNFI